MKQYLMYNDYTCEKNKLRFSVKHMKSLHDKGIAIFSMTAHCLPLLTFY